MYSHDRNVIFLLRGKGKGQRIWESRREAARGGHERRLELL